LSHNAKCYIGLLASILAVLGGHTDLFGAAAAPWFELAGLVGTTTSAWLIRHPEHPSGSL
jgi:hypothetical protein